MVSLLIGFAVALATAIVFGKSGSWKKVAGLALMIYPAMLIANALTLWWIFSEVKSAFINAGWVASPYLQNALIGALALMFYVVLPMVLSAFVRRDKWKFVGFASVLYCGMNLVLFAFSLPSHEQAVNPLTGDYLHKYFLNDERKCVERFDRSIEFHPNRIGVKLPAPDDAIVQQWIKNPCPESAAPKTPPPAPAPQTPANEPAHGFELNKIKVHFESCESDGSGVACIFSSVNTGNEDADLTWYSNMQATDTHGNIYDPQTLDVAGQKWPPGCFWTTCFAERFKDALIPNVAKALHMSFSGVPQTESTFRNLRISVAYVSARMFHPETTEILDFGELAISRPKPKERSANEESPYLVHSYLPEVRKVGSVQRQVQGSGIHPTNVATLGDSPEQQLIFDVGPFGDLKPQGQGGASNVPQQLVLPKMVESHASPQGQPHMELVLGAEMVVHNVTMNNAQSLMWQVITSKPWLVVTRDVSGQERSGTEGPGGHSQPALKVKVASSGMEPGTYDANILIASNDLQNQVVSIPVRLIIGPRATSP